MLLPGHLSKYQKLTIRKTPIETFQGKIVYTQTTYSGIHFQVYCILFKGDDKLF